MKASDYDAKNIDDFIIRPNDFEKGVRLAANALNREIAKELRAGKKLTLIGMPELILDKENMQYSVVQQYTVTGGEDESE